MKASLLLCGSLVEAILLDVAGRNLVIAKSYRPKKSYPDDYSLADLIDVAVSENLLPASVGGMAGSVTEHRDLIHPAAELRGEVKIDRARASAMVAFMNVVISDLKASHEGGQLAAWEQK